MVFKRFLFPPKGSKRNPRNKEIKMGLLSSLAHSRRGFGFGFSERKEEGFVNPKAVTQIAPRTPLFLSHPRVVLWSHHLFLIGCHFHVEGPDFLWAVLVYFSTFLVLSEGDGCWVFIWRFPNLVCGQWCKFLETLFAKLSHGILDLVFVLGFGPIC